MSVAELIAALQLLPQELQVYTEGCDCWGDARAAKVCEQGGGETGDDRCVLIERT